MRQAAVDRHGDLLQQGAAGLEEERAGLGRVIAIRQEAVPSAVL